jgi:DNA-binding GntR family transcriptional regulator
MSTEANRSLTKKPTFAEKAYEVMKRAILRGEIPEGSFLSEEVAKRYGVGRTPFREACNRLHQQQLVDLVPRHGFLVRGISFKDVVDIFELRLMLEVASAEFAVVRGTDAEVQRLFDQTLDSLEVRSTIEKIIDANTRFHLSLAQMSHNAELVRTLANLLERYEALSYAEARNGKLMPQSLKQWHLPIVKAIQSRDSAAARTAMCQDLFESHRLILPAEPPVFAATDLAHILSKAP